MDREEAIEVLKKKAEYLESDKRFKAAVETLISELAESEDERIRKEIVGVIQKHYPNTPESYRWISWLEKQKEQKPNNNFLSIEQQMEAAMIAIRGGMSSKSQEWSEEDENALKYIHELISWGYSEKFMDAQTAHDMRKWVNEHFGPDTFQNGNSRPKASDNWKPSEEQMEELQGAITFMAIHNMKVDSLVSLHKELKKL